MKQNIEEIKQDKAAFSRRIQLAEYFHDKDDEDESLVRNKSHWTPSLGRSTALDNFIKSITNIPLETNNQNNIKQNINKRERKAIQTLSNNSDIIIKEADKGGAVVIMNTKHYKEMAENTLKDENYYKRLERNPKQTEKINYNRLVDKHERCLTDKEIDYLRTFEVKTSQFYGLPKVHKSKQIAEKCENSNDSYVVIGEVKDLKLRPIIAGPSCQTNRLSNLIDILLKPLVKNIPSHLKDTKDFLNKLPTSSSEETLLATFDIESLYSNINHDLGLTAVKYWLERNRGDVQARFTNEFILESLEFILKNNNFQFNDINYNQTKGTAMGTKVAPTYATLTIGYLEQKLYEEIEKKWGENFKLQFIQIWKRFLDDCFIPWNRSKDDIKTLHNILNKLHEDIKFTMECDNKEIPFLDCLVIKTDSKLETDIFYKPTDSKTYLPFYSCHPKHTKTSIPFSLSRRLKTIISNPNIFEKRANELKLYLKRQNYPESLIDAGITKARSI